MMMERQNRGALIQNPPTTHCVLQGASWDSVDIRGTIGVLLWLGRGTDAAPAGVSMEQ